MLLLWTCEKDFPLSLHNHTDSGQSLTVQEKGHFFLYLFPSGLWLLEFENYCTLLVQEETEWDSISTCRASANTFSSDVVEKCKMMQMVVVEYLNVTPSHLCFCCFLCDLHLITSALREFSRQNLVIDYPLDRGTKGFTCILSISREKDRMQMEKNVWGHLLHLESLN